MDVRQRWQTLFWGEGGRHGGLFFAVRGREGVRDLQVRLLDELVIDAHATQGREPPSVN